MCLNLPFLFLVWANLNAFGGNLVFCEPALHFWSERFNLLRKTLLFFLPFSQVMHRCLDNAIKKRWFILSASSAVCEQMCVVISGQLTEESLLSLSVSGFLLRLSATWKLPKSEPKHPLVVGWRNVPSVMSDRTWVKLKVRPRCQNVKEKHW